MIDSAAARNLAFAISGAGVDPAQLLKRSDYQSEGEYYIALAKAAEALDNPNVRRALLNIRRQEQAEAEAAARKAEKERIQKRADEWILTDEQIDALQSAAAEQATKEFTAGDLGKYKTIASRQRELYKELERKERNRLAAHEAANQAIRDAWRAPTPADQEFVDRVINRPVIDPDA